MLASYMGKSSKWSPSFKTLMLDCSISKNSLIRNLKALEQKDLLIIHKEKNKNNTYEFSLLLIDTGIEACKECNIDIGSGASQRLGGLSQAPQVVSHRHPNNIINNINNNKRCLIKDYSGPSQSGDRPSLLLVDFMKTKTASP